MGKTIARFSTEHPWAVTLVMVQVTLLLVVLALLPSVWPATFSSLHGLEVDTDPENMLPEEEPVRVFHDTMKEEMSLYDMVVVGVVNEEHPEGVFNPESLKKIYELTEYAKTLRWPDPANPSNRIGVIRIDVIAPSTVDNIEQGEQPGFVNFEWLMRSPPGTGEEALAVRDRARRIPFLDGTLVSDDGKALALYLPLTSKDLSSRVYDALQEKIAEFDGPESFYITGLPVAEDVFGTEMFKQMAISAPLAMLVVFLLMLGFFRKFSLVISPMIVAVVCVLMTMGLLVVTGNTVHIMSSMIPIFIMPIAVLDAVHILSEFFDRYQETKDRKKTIVHVMDELFVPMLYTSLTTAIGFASLALVPIPPVQVFGLFVAFGVVMAWVWTITFVPAYVMFIKPESLENFGIKEVEQEDSRSGLAGLLEFTGRMTFKYAKGILLVVALLVAVSIYGVKVIQINDNPIKWFTKSHPIRVADRVLNEHFGGTYMAYLTLEAKEQEVSLDDFVAGLKTRLRETAGQSDVSAAKDVFEALAAKAGEVSRNAESPSGLLETLEAYADEQLFEGPEEQYEAWDEALTFLGAERSRDEVFKLPEVLHFIEKLQARLKDTGIVGKSNSLGDIVKTVRRELVSGEQKDFRIPDTPAGVAQTLLQYQNSHRPQDLWHFVTPDYRKSVLWVQLRSGDNRDMDKVVRAIDAFMADVEMPAGVELEHRWFGLTYINVIWQEKMVKGMLQAFLGSFLIVFVMMTFLYRSALWGLLSMVPLTVTIALIYGVIGLVGKDYDMPVAVLSSLSLGLAVDYAIHFLSRSRRLYMEHRSWEKTSGPVFGEPARAIARNAIVIGVGFLPLLAAPLVPYKTVGILIAAILLTAGLASLLILPTLIAVLERLLFPRTRRCCVICNSGTCVLSGFAIILIAVVNIYQFYEIGWTKLSWFSLVAALVLSQVCYLVGRTKRCRMEVPLFADEESNSNEVTDDKEEKNNE